MPKKRANGEGSLRKRKDGRWEGRYTAGNDPATGKPIHKSVLAKTQSEAKEKLKQAIAEAEKLDMSRAKSYALGAWIKLWYEVYAEPGLREKTKDYYLNYIDNHIVPELGNTPLEKLTTIQIQKFYNDLQKSGRIQRYTHIKLKDKGLSTRVVRGIHTLLNNCLEQAVAERLILTNPAKGCRLPKLEKREMKILPEDKIGPYLAEAERRGLLAAFYLELTTGLRRGELLALLWTDLDVENMTISVSKQVNRINGELVVSQPKTPNSVRKLAIPQRAVELLVSWVVFFGAAYIYKKETLLRVDFLYLKAKGAVRLCWEMLWHILECAVLVILTIYGCRYAQSQSTGVTYSLGINRAAYSIPMIYCAASMLIGMIEKIYDSVVNYRQGKKEAT